MNFTPKVALATILLTTCTTACYYYQIPYGGGIDDVDKDGYTSEHGDCNDEDPDIFPSAEDITGDGIDSDCDGKDSSAQTTDDSFSYGGHAYTCANVIGPNADWSFDCVDEQTQFVAGQTLYVLAKIEHINRDFRFRLAAYWNTDLQPRWVDTTDWVEVDGPMWEQAFYWPNSKTLATGTWTLDILVDTGDGFEHIDTLEAEVIAPAVAYRYEENAAMCTGGVSGPSESWQYTCLEPSDQLPSGTPFTALLRLDELWASVRFKTVAVHQSETSLNWQDQTQWIYVGSPAWSTAYYWPTYPSLAPGEWNLDFYADIGRGWEVVDSIMVESLEE